MASEANRLFHRIRELILSARNIAARGVDRLQVLTNFEIGRRIVEHEQKGSARAEYGRQILADLSKRLENEFGKGFSERNLRNMRKFYLTYPDRLLSLGPTPYAKLPARPQASSGQIEIKSRMKKPPKEPLEIWQTASAKSFYPFKLSWSHYVFLIAINNADERGFYEIEAAENGWTLPELKRQFNSGLFERLALSRDKKGIKKLAREGLVVSRPRDLLKEPYVLEFLGLAEQTKYSESDLECAIIDKLERFLLELGKGFLFEARQKRFTFDEEHFFVDLVFYNRLLRGYVLLDLKIGKLTHQDLGQMQMYVNYFDRQVRLARENPTIGIILCKMKNRALVELTLPPNANVFASEYKLYLPSKEELKQKLIEWTEGGAKRLPSPLKPRRKNQPGKNEAKK